MTSRRLIRRIAREGYAWPWSDRLALPRGELHVRVLREGRVIEEWRERNLVVTQAHTVVANLLGGMAQRAITQFGVGTDGTAPAAGNVGLTGAVLRPIAAVTYPAAGQVRFTWYIPTDAAIGMQIREFGLFTQSGLLVARKTRAGAIAKTADISLEGTWTLRF